MEFKQRTVESYPELFEEGSNGEIDTSGIGSFATKWGWYQSIFALANGNIERLEHITKLGALECFTMLAFMKEKNELEARQLKKNFK